MKKIIRKLKGKKVLSLVLAAIMLATTFNMALPMLELDAIAAETIEDVTQERIVGTDGSYATTYDNYAAQYLNGASNPTNMVIPGLSNSQDYVVQGMSYYPEKDWMLITAYHGDSDETGTVKSSKVFALDAATGDFVAMFDFYNPGTTVLNTEHGGGIAISEHNIYYACGDDDREIAYAPLSELELEPGQKYKTIQLADSADFMEVGSVDYDGKTGYTAYVCYDNGVLWTGNFYDEGVQLLPGMDFTKIANGYNAPSNNTYKSMVYGYRLSGETPQEEWANLVNELGDKTKDCRGIPSYAIGLSNAIKDIQYAVVDNGKLYLSCSFGTGQGTLSVRYAGMDPLSSLVVADIDLTQPGTIPIEIRTHLGPKTIYAYGIEDYKNFYMMPMSEGLCVVNDNIFITFESASYKYREKAGIMGNCGYPVDVVWQLDPYELMETNVAEPEKSIYYEKITNTDQIIDGEEYIIVHESKVKNPVSQKNYLYALNAKGNLQGRELSKSSSSKIVGYDAMIGHPISYYSYEKIEKNGKEVDILYFENPEEDDIANIRWTLSKRGDDRYSIKNTSTYFANYNSLYFNSNKITMASNEASYLSYINIAQRAKDSDYFYLSNKEHNDGYYLWCNDGLNDNYNSKANAYYTSNKTTYPLLDGVSEVPGTFHTDAMNISGTNILGGQINTADDDPAIPYEDEAFQIYHRVVDDAASTYESRVYTDLDAELQADGTYTVTLETFAISPNHYQHVGERPTDYIIVADTSSSMADGGSTGITEFTTPLKVGSMISDREDIKKTDNDTIVGYAFNSAKENIHFKHTDGKYYKGYMAIRNAHEEDGCQTQFVQYYYVYYIADDGYYYCLTNLDNEDRQKYTEDEFKNWVDGNAAIQTASSTRANIDTGLDSQKRTLEEIVNTVHYRFDDTSSEYTDEYTRISTLKTAASDIVDNIAAQNPDNRIALVTYGSSGSYLGSSGWATSGYTDAFWNVDDVNTLKTQISNIKTTSQTRNDGIELEVANEIIDKSDFTYKTDEGARNVAIIFLSDGIPGQDGGSSTKEAANAVIDKALTAKNKGAFIYSVLIGNNSVNGFNKKAYMDAVSSKYAAAESLTTLGGQSVDGINYALSLAATSVSNYFNFGEIITEEVKHNAAVGLDNLDANSYLREQLSDAFKFPANTADYNVNVELVTGAYDEIGRFSFIENSVTSDKNVADAAKISAVTNAESKTITVTNYNYSEEYIAKYRTNPGRKLRITITGLLADETAQIQNTSISNTDAAAIYKTKDDMDKSTAEKDLSFKKLPTTYFNIPEYTYVFDYGLPLHDTAINGELCSVDGTLAKQSTYKVSRETDNMALNFVNDNLDMTYELKSSSEYSNTKNSSYCLIKRDNGTYDWFKVKLVPASNIYYEEDRIVTAGTSGRIEWTQEGTTENVYRDATIGESVYGYDKHYDNDSSFSNKSCLKVDVTSEKGNTTSKKKSFTFTGTGFDLMSACGENTGVLAVGIKKFDEATQKLKTVKAFMVDTYYNDANVSSLISQVPVVKWEGAYGTYTVDVAAIYVANAGGVTKSVAKNNLIDTGLVMNSAEPTDSADIAAILESVGMEDMIADDMELIWFDDNSIFNGGTGVAPTVKKTRADETAKIVTLENYIDGFRVYNPLGTDQSAYEASEKNAKYVNVLDNLMDKSGNVGAFGYIIGGQNDELTWANYETVGPQGEVYLNKNQSITFNVTVDQAEKVMLGLRAVNGATSVTISNTANNAYKVENVPINSATEMYYDITKCFGGVAASNTPVNITITNASGGILAINHVKHSGGDGSVGSGIVTRTNARSTGATEAQDLLFAPFTEANLVDVQNSMNLPGVQGIVKNGVIIPLVEGEDEVPGDNTTPDTGDDNTNDDTNTDSEGQEEFSIFALLELLISLIEKILYNAFGAGSLF